LVILWVLLRRTLSGPDDFYPLLKLGRSSEAILQRLINDADGKGMTPLIVGCVFGHAGCVEFLMKHGANPFMMVSEGVVRGV